VDTYGARMRGSRKLECELTSRNGRVVYDLNGITREDWEIYVRATRAGTGRWSAKCGVANEARLSSTGLSPPLFKALSFKTSRRKYLRIRSLMVAARNRLNRATRVSERSYPQNTAKTLMTLCF